MKKTLVCILWLFLCGNNWAQDVVSYLKKFALIAVQEMERSGIPASIKLGQGILESAYGNSFLAQMTHNHFGIKCGKDWSGPTFDYDDDRRGECFRKYNAPWHSFRDHSEFLKKPRYAKLFSLPKEDYKAWAKELKRAGYATAKDYAQRLISRIKKYQLWRFDRVSSQDLEYRLDEFLSGMGLKGDDFILKESHFTDFSARDRVRYHENGGLKYIVVEEGETLAQMSRIYDISIERLMHYNDFSFPIDRFLVPGQYLFLETKNRSGAMPFYKVGKGEDMHTISQKTGIRLEKLYYRNRMELGSQVYPGDILYLQGRKDKT